MSLTTPGVTVVWQTPLQHVPPFGDIKSLTPPRIQSEASSRRLYSSCLLSDLGHIQYLTDSHTSLPQPRPKKDGSNRRRARHGQRPRGPQRKRRWTPGQRTGSGREESWSRRWPRRPWTGPRKPQRRLGEPGGRGRPRGSSARDGAQLQVQARTGSRGRRRRRRGLLHLCESDQPPVDRSVQPCHLPHMRPTVEGALQGQELSPLQGR